MSVIDEVLKANKRFCEGQSIPKLPVPPARKLAILTCMDARIDVFSALGLELGDAHVIRNAGGIATEDAIRSLIISHHLLGTREIMIINHTDCGMTTFKDDEFKDTLRNTTGKDAETPRLFHAFSNLRDNVREQLQRVRSHPWLPDDLIVRGFVYDVASGALSESE